MKSSRKKNTIRGVIVAADDLLAESTMIVPFDKGFSGGLASTANKLNPVIMAEMMEITVGYNKTYAARLHEDMTLKIKQTWTRGATRSQKYLEIPMKRDAEKYGKIIADFMKAV